VAHLRSDSGHHMLSNSMSPLRHTKATARHSSQKESWSQHEKEFRQSRSPKMMGLSDHVTITYSRILVCPCSKEIQLDAFTLTMIEPGERISYLGQIATVRFVGTVKGTSGTWLGVEWDDPTRGKHDGEKNGRQYFTCL
jgi:hypothetical protein